MEKLAYSIYRGKKDKENLIGYLPLDVIKAIHGGSIEMVCKPRNGEKPFVIVK